MFAAFGVESLQESCPLSVMCKNSSKMANTAWHRLQLWVLTRSISCGNWCCFTAAGVMQISSPCVKQISLLILVSEEMISAGAGFFLYFWCETASHVLIAKHWVVECLASQGNFVLALIWQWIKKSLCLKFAAVIFILSSVKRMHSAI